MSGSKIKVKIYTKRTLKIELSTFYTNGAIFYTIFHTTICTVFTLSNIILSVSTKKKNQDNLLIKNESEFYQYLVVTIYSRVTLKVSVFVCTSREQFPNKSIFTKMVSVKSSNHNQCYSSSSGGYIFHPCTWDSGECIEKLIKHQSHNCKLWAGH